MTFTFSDRRDIDLYQLQKLFNSNAFWAEKRSIQDLQQAISNSHPVVTVWEREKLIGFARATSDGVFRATIWDVVVDVGYQRQGIGTKLVQSILYHPHLLRCERVYLHTTHKESFYKKLGFQVNDTLTMVLVPTDRPKVVYEKGAISLSTIRRSPTLKTPIQTDTESNLMIRAYKKFCTICKQLWA